MYNKCNLTNILKNMMYANYKSSERPFALIKFYVGKHVINQ